MSGKASWILKKQREYKEITSEIIKPTFEEGSTLPYLGKNYPIKILRDQSEYTIKFLDGKFTVGIKSLAHTNNLQTIIRKLYEDWLMEKAESIFRQKVRHYSKKLGLLVRRVIVKRLRNRWGSMTKEGRINLNVNLLKAPNDVIDYIILHEICHLKGSLAQQRRYKPF
jgi:predicted metal-dependent hydrolase